MSRVKIVIDLNNQQEADDKIDDVRQIFMRRNPMDEPSIYTEVQTEDHYLSPNEVKELERLLARCSEDTLSCWKATRLKGASASMACEGNVSPDLLRIFDQIRAAL